MRYITIAFAAMLLGAGAAAIAKTKAPPAKLTMAQAQEIALKAEPGKLIKAEYEEEKGSWRYTFDIRVEKGRIREVGVDPNTGGIIENVWDKD